MNDLEQPISEAYRGVTTHHPDHPKAYVSSFKNADGEVNFKSSDKHGHVKFWNRHGRNSAIKHAGIDPTDERLQVKASGKHPLEEEELQEGIKKVGTYFTKKGGDTATLHQADHDPNHHMVVVNGKVTRHIQGSAEEAHKQLTADGFQGSLHEMYHGGTAGYEQANKGDNIHHGVVMVHGTSGARKVKKIHWADTASFHGQVAVPASASKNEQVRRAKKEGWRVDHHVASLSHDTVKRSLDNHHKRIIANDRMAREGIKRRAALKETTSVEISREDYDLIKEAHTDGVVGLEAFAHGVILPINEGKSTVTYSHDLHELPTIEHDRSTGTFRMYITEISKDLLARYAERVSKMTGAEMMKDKGISKLCSRLSELGHARRKLNEYNLSELSDEEILGVLADEQDYLDFKTKMRHRQVYNEGTEQEEQPNVDQINELSVHLLRHYSKEALTQLRARKGEKGWKKKEIKRDKMVDLACHKAVGQDVKVPGRCDEDLLEASLATLSQLRYKKNNADEEEEIKAELEADGKVGATDPKAEEENEHMKGSVSEGIGAKLYYAHVSKDGKPHGRVEIKALDHKNAIWQSTHIPVVLKGTKVDKVTTHDGQTVSEEVEDLEEGRRGRPRKDAKPVEGDEPNIIMSLRKAAYSTVGHKVQFKDGSHTIVHSRHAEKILNHFNGLKPHEKVQFQNHLMKGAEHVQNWHTFSPEDHKRQVPTEKKLTGTAARTVKKANRILDRRETIRRIAAKLQAQKAK